MKPEDAKPGDIVFAEPEDLEVFEDPMLMAAVVVRVNGLDGKTWKPCRLVAVYLDQYFYDGLVGPNGMKFRLIDECHKTQREALLAAVENDVAYHSRHLAIAEGVRKSVS